MIYVGEEWNVAFGGFGKDNITGLGGRDHVCGDNCKATFNNGTTLIVSVEAISPGDGGM